MSTSNVVLLLAAGVVLLVGSVLIRVLSSGKYEIKTIDLAFIVVPLLVVGLATGRLQGLDLFGVKADFSKLFAEAANKQIKDTVGQSPVSSVQEIAQFIEAAPKVGINEIPHLIEQKTEAISFRLGSGGYYAPAIKEYFEKLFGSSYLKFVVIENPDGTLFGVFAAADLIPYLNAAAETGYSEFESLLNRGDDTARQRLARLPGFIAADAAVTTATTKRDALARMDTLDRNSLPVIDADRRFIGTVERSKLISSMLLAVTNLSSGE